MQPLDFILPAGGPRVWHQGVIVSSQVAPGETCYFAELRALVSSCSPYLPASFACLRGQRWAQPGASVLKELGRRLD